MIVPLHLQTTDNPSSPSLYSAIDTLIRKAQEGSISTELLSRLAQKTIGGCVRVNTQQNIAAVRFALRVSPQSTFPNAFPPTLYELVSQNLDISNALRADKKMINQLHYIVFNRHTSCPIPQILDSLKQGDPFPFILEIKKALLDEYKEVTQSPAHDIEQITNADQIKDVWEKTQPSFSQIEEGLLIGAERGNEDAIQKLIPLLKIEGSFLSATNKESAKDYYAKFTAILDDLLLISSEHNYLDIANYILEAKPSISGILNAIKSCCLRNADNHHKQMIELLLTACITMDPSIERSDAILYATTFTNNTHLIENTLPRVTPFPSNEAIEKALIYAIIRNHTTVTQTLLSALRNPSEKYVDEALLATCRYWKCINSRGDIIPRLMTLKPSINGVTEGVQALKERRHSVYWRNAYGELQQLKRAYPLPKVLTDYLFHLVNRLSYEKSSSATDVCLNVIATTSLHADKIQEIIALYPPSPFGAVMALARAHAYRYQNVIQQIQPLITLSDIDNAVSCIACPKDLKELLLLKPSFSKIYDHLHKMISSMEDDDKSHERLLVMLLAHLEIRFKELEPQALHEQQPFIDALLIEAVNKRFGRFFITQLLRLNPSSAAIDQAIKKATCPRIMTLLKESK